MKLKRLLSSLDRFGYVKEVDIGKAYVLRCNLCSFHYGTIFEHPRKAKRCNISCLRYEGPIRSGWVTNSVRAHMKENHPFEYSIGIHKSKKKSV